MNPNPSSVNPQQWLATQRQQGHELLLIIDSLATPDPLPQIFAATPLREYINLYKGTEFDSLAAMAPWLIKIDEGSINAVLELLKSPEPHWGWIASAPQIRLDTLAEHWRERMVINENQQRWFYRFQDNRVISTALAALSPQEAATLLGPLTGALCWNGESWHTFDNPRPTLYAKPFATPWADLLPTETVRVTQLRDELGRWLWAEHSEACARVAEAAGLSSWLEQQLQQASEWGWQEIEQLHFLLAQKLQPEKAADPCWTPQPDDTVAKHFRRCQQTLTPKADNGWDV